MATPTSFEIVLSRTLNPNEVSGALAKLLPNGLRIDVAQDMDGLPSEPGAIWALIDTSNDPAWPCIFNVLVCREECQLTPYPDLRIAMHLGRVFGTDALCDTYPFVGELDPHDPYWSLAYVEGSWHLASTAGTPLMGPYTDGKKTFQGDGRIQLRRPVTLPSDLT
jgi:hypothetical protein